MSNNQKHHSQKRGSHLRLIVVTGLPGTGKSTVAKAIAEEIDAILFRTDVIRKSLFPKPSYSLEEQQHVYDEMFVQAHQQLKKHKSVVLDANFSKQIQRDQAVKLAEKAGVEPLILEIICQDEKLIAQRLEKRGNDASDATFRVYLLKKAAYEHLEEPYIQIENCGSLPELKNKIASFIRSLE